MAYSFEYANIFFAIYLSDFSDDIMTFDPTCYTFSESSWFREGSKVMKSGNFDQKKIFFGSDP